MKSEKINKTIGPGIMNNSWVCVSCGIEYKNDHNVGITNSVSNKTQCIKCYNAGVKVELV